MRKTEKQYAWILLNEQHEGKILTGLFEHVTFYLTEPQPGTKRVSYTPDFFCVLPDGTIRIDEIKGPFIREDSVLKFKLAADKYPWFHWRMIQIDKKGVTTIRDIPRRPIPPHRQAQIDRNKASSAAGPPQNRVTGNLEGK